MSSPLVTVLLPVYNSAETVKATLDSIWDQTFTDFELLVVDDGSTDNTPDILNTVSDPRLRVVTNPQRLKLSGALNRGIGLARGRLIARMDADDLCKPERLARQVMAMTSYPDVVVCGTWTRHFGDRKKSCERYPVSNDAIRAFSYFNCPFAHPTVMFRRDPFVERGWQYDGRFYPTEDFELWSRVVHQVACINLPEVLLDYRVHGKSMTGSDWTNMDAQAVRLIGNQFKAKGLELSEERLRLHRDIGMARVDGDQLIAARDHLAALLQSNLTGNLCDPEAWQTEIRERWFHVCMNARGGDSDRVALYADEAIWQGGRVPMVRLQTMKASRWRRG